MDSLQSWRKAFGVLKDSTTVGLAKINSDYKDLDVAIVKATNHVESPPRERHIRKIIAATSMSRPRGDVVYCVQALASRLQKTHNWTVALKTLMVIHRTLREGDPTFREELLQLSQRGQFLHMSNFKDDSTPLAWDYSAWVRTYGMFLEERLECFRILRFDIEAEFLTKSPGGSYKGNIKGRLLGGVGLLVQLPALQQLLFRLLGCKPEGAASSSGLVQLALFLVLRESFKIYCIINDGVINLVDLVFEMPRYDAIKALDIYKRTCRQAEELSNFYKYCKSLELARTFEFPTLKQPPSTFLANLGEYIQEATQISPVIDRQVEHREANSIYPEQGKDTQAENSKISLQPEEKQENQTMESAGPAEPQESTLEVASHAPATGDLLGFFFPDAVMQCMDEICPTPAELGDGNALPSAIHKTGDSPRPPVVDKSLDLGTSGWGLALATAPSCNDRHLTESKLAGGFDMLLLDSLYDNASSRNQQNVEGYGGSLAPNLFGLLDPFATSNAFLTPPSSVQISVTAQQQLHMEPQSMQALPYSHSSHFPQPLASVGSANPFSDALVGIPHSISPQGTASLL